jgi:predicted MPP superfamily phosphohydrolase
MIKLGHKKFYSAPMIFLQIGSLLSIAVVSLFGAHFFLYFSLTHFFLISDYHKNYLIFILFFLGNSFIIFSIIAHWKENIITRILYFLSGFWWGFLANLMLAIIAIWFAIWLNYLLVLDINIPALELSFFALAFLLSLYSTWNAYFPKIKKIFVTIPDLPKNWQAKKIVHISDVHLGHLYRASFLQGIVKKINSQYPEMVVITGDLFDGMDGNLESLTAPLNNLKTNRGVFFVNGNHETYLGMEKTYAVLEKTKVRILQDEVIDIDGLKLIGISYPDRGEKKDIPATLKKLKPDFFGKPNIFIYHSPVNISQIAKNGVNLQLSGHTHLGQLFPFNFITKAIYHGYDYGLHHLNNYTLYVTNGVGTWGPMMRSGNVPEIVVITLE